MPVTAGPTSELDAMLNAAAVAPLHVQTGTAGESISRTEARAFLRVTGEDRTRWLNGMVTNSAQALAEGEGNYNFLLNAQGRIQGDCTLWRDGQEFLLETTQGQVDAIQQHLDRFIIMDDVELMPVMTAENHDQHGLLVVGPAAAAHLATLRLAAPTPNHLAHDAYAGQPVLILAPAAAVPTFELWSAPETIAAITSALALPFASQEALEDLRILNATPRFGKDIRERDLPQETEQTHALHFAKGCYLGQEIVERIRSRGQVHRGFTAFALEGAPPTLPAPLTLDGKPAGELTSAAVVHGRLLALG